MEYDLRHELAALAEQPVAGDDALPLVAVARRVRLGRAVRAAGVTTVAAAGVVGLAVTVQAAPWRVEPAPPVATGTPTASHAPTTVVSPRPTPSAAPVSPTTPPVAPRPPLAGVTTVGEVVTLDPETGAVLEILATGIEGTTDVAKIGVDVSPDGASVFVSSAADATGEVSIVRVDVATGSVEPVATGVNPAVSPDGRTLAYAGPDPQATEEGWGLNLLDLASGEVRHLADPDSHPEAWIWTPAWSVDGASIDVPTWRGILRVDATARSLGDATTVLPVADDQPHTAARLGDGSLLVHVDEGGYFPDPVTMRLVVVDGATGAMSDEVAGAAGLALRSLSVSPGGTSALVLGSTVSPDREEGPARLMRWDGGEGLLELAQAPALAAIGW